MFVVFAMRDPALGCLGIESLTVVFKLTHTKKNNRIPNIRQANPRFDRRFMYAIMNLLFNWFIFNRSVPMPCQQVQNELVRQMEDWNGDENCGKTSEECPKLPCGQLCLYYVSFHFES